MNAQILKAIIDSCASVTNETENREIIEAKLLTQTFPPTDHIVLSGLAKSLSNLLTYKVSPEVYQRYSVRIQIIEILREWLQATRGLASLRTFLQGDKVVEFTSKILSLYVTNQSICRDDTNIGILVNLARALICLIPKNKSFLSNFQLLIETIGSLKQTNESEQLFLSVLEEKDTLNLRIETITLIYICQRFKLIEEPFIENFIENFKNSKPPKNHNFKISGNLENLLKVTIYSPPIFQIISNILKELFIRLDYSSKVLDYTQFFLKSIHSLCTKENKSVLDLYPLKLQSYVMLLDIEPEQHTQNSQEYVIKFLVDTIESNPEEALIIMTHFPKWLKITSTYLIDDSKTEDTRSVVTVMSIDD